MNLANRRQAFRIVSGQLAASLFIALALLSVGWMHAYSGLIGGAIATLANAYFTLRLFVRYRAQEPARMLNQFFGAELQKILLTGILFACTFVWIKPLSVGALFGGYILVLLVPIVAANFFD